MSLPREQDEDKDDVRVVDVVEVDRKEGEHPFLACGALHSNQHQRKPNLIIRRAEPTAVYVVLSTAVHALVPFAKQRLAQMSRMPL